MRSRIFTSLLLSLALAPGFPALAQDAQGGQDEEAGGSETEGAEVVDEAPATQRETGTVKIPPGQGGRESAPGEVHTVEKGDTLWDLSQKYLGSPWYWPKVWSYNPEIANPHWIYPGNQVRFFGAGEEVPSRVESGLGPAPMTIVAEEGDAPELTEVGPISGEEMVSVSGKIGYDTKAPGRSVQTQGFVTQRELDEAGRIDSSFSEAVMLSYPDTVYVRFKKGNTANIGDRYVVFHTGAEIKHPATGQKIGYLTEFLGTMKVIAKDDKFVTAQILETWDAVSRGDLVGPFNVRLSERVAPKPNEKEVKGYVVTSLVPDITITGEHNFLVVDKGSAAGVQVGNTFNIVRQADIGDMFEPQKVDAAARQLPQESIGVCMVTEVKERTSNCLIVQSIREIVPGDRAVMRVGSPASAPTAQR
ncbi:LysM domain-containing protein [Myxococcaceae bacterium GXIMD 01537]